MLLDLYRAYKDARRHKRSSRRQVEFEMKLENNLSELCDELMARTYRPQASVCFIIHDPKMREVFAADFRDRIVHHLFYNYTHCLFERTFIADSYSCIKHRGTHYGIKRLRHHIAGATEGYKREAYVLKLDISGYFMHIDRGRLLDICRRTLQVMSGRMSDKPGVTWCHAIDYAFVDYLLKTIVMANPVESCTMIGDKREWTALPDGKSLFTAADGCGLPIGNLSSQLFSNVYMNVFDQFMKRTLGCRRYGRYVDDSYVVSRNRKRLEALVPEARAFLLSELGLDLNLSKCAIVRASYGVEFLGAFIKPFRIYPSSSSFRRMKRKVYGLPVTGKVNLQPRVNSFLGVLSHYDCYCLRCVDIEYKSRLSAVGRFSAGCLKFQGR